MTWFWWCMSASPRSGLVKLRLDMIWYLMSNLGSNMLYTHSCTFTSHNCSSGTQIPFVIGPTTCFSKKHLAFVVRWLILCKYRSEDQPSWGVIYTVSAVCKYRKGQQLSSYRVNYEYIYVTTVWYDLFNIPGRCCIQMGAKSYNHHFGNVSIW